MDAGKQQVYAETGREIIELKVGTSEEPVTQRPSRVSQTFNTKQRGELDSLRVFSFVYLCGDDMVCVQGDTRQRIPRLYLTILQKGR